MAKNAVIRTDLMHGTKNPDMLVSLRFYANDAVAEVENGVIVELNYLLKIRKQNARRNGQWLRRRIPRCP